MADFSHSEIDEAKRRVREMQSKAGKFITDENSPRLNTPNHTKTEENTAKNPDGNNEKDNSSLIILALILLLSHEEADNTLIFALLYLLL